ncbi:MAG TPA: CorA family divalent cation transporter, partial [Acetomicrobium sp.]|nr:CorA family divalent cation transporter [Acetomicrobium sp.]
MKKSKKGIDKKVGTPPETLIYTGDKGEEFEITITDYNATGYKRIRVKDVDECASFKDSSTVTWIDVVGLHRVDAIEKIGKIYNLHPLVLEDILNIHQRAKIEYFEDYIFIVLKMLTYDDKS